MSRRAPLIALAVALAGAAALALVVAVSGGDGEKPPLHSHSTGICVDQGDHVTVQLRVHNQGPAATFPLTPFVRLADGTVRRGEPVPTTFAAEGYPVVSADVPLHEGDRTPAPVGRYCGFEDVVLEPEQTVTTGG